MNIDFNKLLDDYLQEFHLKHPNPHNDPVLGLSIIYAENAAKVCVEILERYHQSLIRGIKNSD